MGALETVPSNPFDDAYLSDPYPWYQAAQNHTPVVYHPDLDVWIITRYTDVRTILLDPAHYSSAYLIRTPYQADSTVHAILQDGYPEVPMLVNHDPPDHTRIRTLVAPAFAPSRIEALEDRIRTRIDSLLAELTPAPQTDLMATLAYPLPMQIIGDLLGIPLTDADQIKAWTHDLITLTAPTTPPDQQQAAAHASVAFERYLADLVAHRRADPQDDLLTTLLQATDEKGQPLTTADLISLLIVLIFAGHETTTNLIGNALLQVLSQPLIWDTIRVDPTQVPAIIEEVLRIDAPVQAMFRTTTTDVTLHDTTIPAGARLWLLFGAANRDATVFPDPAVFNHHRANLSQHLGFGWGIHFCIGVGLARLETQLVLTALAERFPQLRFQEGYQPTYLPSMLHRGPQHLLVRWD